MTDPFDTFKSHKDSLNLLMNHIQIPCYCDAQLFVIKTSSLHISAAEEKENINAVIRHIEKETCIEFRDLTDSKDDVPDKDDTSSEYHFDTREDGLVVLGSDEHTKAILPDTSSDEQRLANEIKDPLKKAVRKRVDGKDKSVEGKDKSVIGKDKSVHGKDKSVVKVANTNIKGKNDTNVVVKGNNTNIDNKIKTANVTSKYLNF